MTSQRRYLTSALPILIIVSILSLIILLLGHNPLTVFSVVLNGSLGSSKKIADTLVIWVSLSIISTGLLVSFRAGQWNIGAEGQIGMGAICAYGLGAWCVDHHVAPLVALPMMVVVGSFGGALWGLVAALLKRYGGVSEIFAGLGLNFIVTSLTIYLIAGPWRPVGESSVSTSPLLPEAYWLPTLPNLRLSPISLILAIVVLVTIILALRGTIWGLQLKAIGRNNQAANLLGVPTERILFTAYATCGMCAGLVGSLLIVAVRHQMITGISSGIGFLAILIVLLAGQKAWFVAPIALFFAIIGTGGTALPTRLGLDSSFGGLLTGLSALIYELAQGWRNKKHTS